MCRTIMQSLTQCVQPCIFFVLQPLLLCEGWGGHPLCLSGDSSVLMDLHWSCSCTTQRSILSIGSVSVTLLWWCEAFPWTIFDSSRSPLFQSGQVFHQLVCLLTVVLPQIFFNLTTLFSYPVFFRLFHAPLDVVVHFLVFLRSFKLKSFLSQFSPFVAQIKNTCSDPGIFLLTMFCQGSHSLFRVKFTCPAFWISEHLFCFLKLDLPAPPFRVQLTNSIFWSTVYPYALPTQIKFTCPAFQNSTDQSHLLEYSVPACSA